MKRRVMLFASMMLSTLVTADQSWRVVVREFEGRTFRIEVPAHYAHEANASPQPGVTTIGFTGDEREDGTRPLVQISLVKLPGKMDSSSDVLDGFASKMIASVERRREKWKVHVSDIRVGDVNARRYAWRGFVKKPESEGYVLMRGVMLVGIDSDVGFALHTQDLDAYSAEALPIGEASLRTFRLR